MSYSVDLRERALALVDGGMSQEEVRKLLNPSGFIPRS